MSNQTINGIHFSKRELEVIACLCSGCSTKIIASTLDVSISSVNSYVQRIMLKMNCYSRWGVVRFVETSDSYVLIRNIYVEIRLVSEHVDNVVACDGIVENSSKLKTVQSFLKHPKKSFATVSVIVCCICSGVLFSRDDRSISFEIPAMNEQIFLPREKITGDIDKAFSTADNLRFLVLLGAGGIGKTTIARDYLSRGNFSVKAEIDAESEFKIIESFENLLFLLCKTDKEHKILQTVRGIKNTEEKRKKLKVILSDLLSGYKSWCFLYDNADDLGVLKKWIPLDNNLFKNGNILITTRNENIKNLILPWPTNVIKVGYLSCEESEELFCRLSKQLNKNSIYDKKLVKSLLREIPAAPLDIVSAVHFIHRSNTTLKGYLSLIKERGMRDMNHKITNEFSDYSKTRESIIATTFDKILQVSDQNFELLMMLCLLDSQNIDKERFQTIASDEVVDAFFYELKKYSILDKNTKFFSIHRLNQEMGLAYLLGTFSKENKRKCLTKLVDAIAPYTQIEWKWSKSEIKISKDKARLLIPHLESMLSKLKNYKDLENYIKYNIKILAALYFAYNGETSYKESYERGKQLLAINSENKVITGRDLALILLQHVYVSIYCGEIEDIENNAKECLSICEKTENTDHLKVGAMLYLARYYFDLVPDYEKATNLLEKIFDIKKTISVQNWDIVMCVFANQIYRSYEACYINDKQKMLEAIGYLKEALKAKGFTENYRQNGIQDIPVDKTVFIMYAA